MKRIRIGNNIAIEWLLYENDGNVHNLEGKDLELYMTCGGLKFVVPDYTVTENAIAWTFPAQTQTRTGYYKLVLIERNEQLGLKSYDVREAFCLEPEDALENIETIVNKDCSVRVKSVLTYAHITNIACVNTVEASDGKSTTVSVTLTNGKTFTLPFGSGSASGVNVIDNLNSFSVDDALSANMGRSLKEMIQNLSGVEVVDNLTSVSPTKALSANMGRELKRLIDSIETGGTSPGGSYELQIAGVGASGQLGGIRVGSGLSINASTGVLSVTGGGDNPSGDGSDQAEKMFSSASEPGDPGSSPSNWHWQQGQDDIWMAIHFKENGEWGDWTVIYIGDIVAPYATFKAFAFTRSNASSVSTPTGGSYSSPVPTTSGWTDGIPSGGGAVWVSSRTFASDDTHSDAYWSTPTLLADSGTMDYEFSSVANPGTPSKTSPSAAQTNPNWSNTATESTIWMAMREIKNGEYAPNSTWMIVKIKGEDGQDGTSVNIKGSVDDVNELPDSDNVAGDGYILTTNGHLYVWDGDSWVDCGQIKGDNGDDGQTPYLHIKYSNDGGLHFTGNNGEDPGNFIGLYCDHTAEYSSDVTDYVWKNWKGEDGFGYEYIFLLNNSSTAPNLPTANENVDDFVPTSEGWTDDPGGVSPTNKFCWVAWRKKEAGTWGAWQGTTNGKARLYAHYGLDGSDGEQGQGQFLSVVYKRSSSQPSTPSGGNFGSPVPSGWSDGIPALETTTGDSELNTLWTSRRRFTSDGLSPQEANWSTPIRATDSEDWDFEYAKQQTNDARPADPTTANRHGGSGTQVWFDPDLDTTEDFTQMYWMAMREKRNGQYVGSWTVLRIKGEGAPGVDGKDAKPIRIRNWDDIAGVTLTGNNKVFSGFGDGDPFRDVIVVNKGNYPSNINYPFQETISGNNEYVPTLLCINYSNSYSDGFPGSYFQNSTLPQGSNWNSTVSADATTSASEYANGRIWGVFTNMGAIYAQILVATQGYIGNLTVDELLARNATVTEQIIVEDIQATGGTIGGYTITPDGYLHATSENGGSINMDLETISGSRTIAGYNELFYLGQWTGANNGILYISTGGHPTKYAIVADSCKFGEVKSSKPIVEITGSSYSFDTSDTGTTFIVKSSSAVTVSLPSNGTGAYFDIITASTTQQTTTLTSSSTNIYLISNGSVSSSNSVSLSRGYMYRLYSTASAWYVVKTA